MSDVSDDDIHIPEEYFELSHSQLTLDSNESTQKAYTAFSEARLSINVIRFMALFFIPILIYMFVMSLLHAKSWYFIAAIAISMLAIRTPIFVFYAYLRRKIKEGDRSPMILMFRPWIPVVGAALILYSAAAPGLFLLARVLNGRCESLDQTHMYGCNWEIDVHALPQEHMLCIMIMPLLMSTIFKGVRTYVIVLAWLCAVFFIALCIGIAGAYQSIPALLAYMPMSICILFENHRQSIILFLVLRKQQKLLEENRTLAEAAQNELRFMIANMAHDLKTPLSSFMNGVETLSSLVDDCSTNDDADKSFYLHAIKDNIKNLFNVNNFMTMTVNRCIDYMKASKGIKLEPRFETINLQEVIAMPLNCMRDLQSRIGIQLNPIPVSVCSHVITDLQWFQENLFCLISNAVKYSSQGQVSLSVSLTSADQTMIAAAKKKIDVLRQNSVAERRETVGGHEEYVFLDKLPTPSERITEWDSAHSSLTSTSRSNVKYQGLELAHDQGLSDAEEGAAGGVEMTHTRSNRLLLVEVEDTGIGLSDEVKASLFTPFKQAQRRAGGTGLGLYSLAKRVDALGGYYGVCNRRDGQQGSIFWFAIPYREDLLMARLESNKDVNMIEAQHRAMQAEREAHSYLPHLDSITEVPEVLTCDDLVLLNLQSISEAENKQQEEKNPSPKNEKGESPKVTPRNDIPKVSPRNDTPKTTPRASAAPTPEPTASAPPEPVPLGKLRVLLVDDSLPILKMTGNLLKRQGHVVDQEVNGADALTRLEKSRTEGITYEVMLMDLNMPVMDGLEAMKRLRETERQLNSVQSERVYHQKVFAFSANSDHTTMLEAMEAGADDFISKPFSIQTFQDKCSKLSRKPSGQSLVS